MKPTLPHRSNTTFDESKPPVILQVLPKLRSGGVERGTIDIARAISQAGWTSLVASSGGSMVPLLANAGASHIELPLDSKNPLTIRSNAHKLADIVRHYGVNIIHARSRAPVWSAEIAARSTGTHFITTFHGTYGLQNEWKRKYNAVMTRGERIIAVSNFIANHIMQNYGTDPSRIRTIHRSVDLKLFNPAGQSPQRMIALSKEWRLPEHLPLILFPGRITRWKGQDVFIRALAKLPHRHFFSVILGDDTGHEKYRAELEQLIGQSGLEGHVRIAKHTSSVTEAYQLSKLVVATSLEPEAFGRVVLEAQAMGRPVIATNHGGPQETVIPNVTGWLVTPGNVEELALNIDHALRLDDESLFWMGEQGIANARYFSLELMCEHTLSVYREVLSISAPQHENSEMVEA